MKMKMRPRISFRTVADVLWFLERYNGWGTMLHHRGVNSPYLWGRTNKHTRGKYVADGEFDSNAQEGQWGAAAILREMINLGPLREPALGIGPEDGGFEVAREGWVRWE